MSSLSSALVVVAHPDDEVLGAGGLCSRLSDEGVSVRAAVLCADAAARAQRPADVELRADLYEAARVLGMGEPILGNFPNIRMNTVAHLDLVQFVESAIALTRAELVVTHHPGDLNDDHRQVSMATQAASRLAQRVPGHIPLRGLLLMEVPSSTDWAFPAGDAAFSPTSFIELGERHLSRKIEALAAYRGVMRPYPHPRSRESLRGLARVRGSQAGMHHAEAFDTRFLDLGSVLR